MVSPQDAHEGAPCPTGRESAPSAVPDAESIHRSPDFATFERGPRYRQAQRLRTEIRRFCMRCQGRSAETVQLCPSNGEPTRSGKATTSCPLWPLRMRQKPQSIDLLQLVRRKCADCLHTSREIESCTVPGCELYAHRLGAWPVPAGGRKEDT